VTYLQRVAGWFKRLFRHRHRWIVVPCYFPHKPGWGLMCAGCRAALDTGLTKAEAMATAKRENAARGRG
jgi:hypothetical protein